MCSYTNLTACIANSPPELTLTSEDPQTSEQIIYSATTVEVWPRGNAFSDINELVLCQPELVF